jgi:organic hydroperoxide reductase OsmC/OhrA
MSMGIHYNIDLEWHSSDNAGRITTPTGDLPYSGLGQTDCGSNGPCPEDLLIAAISSSYSIILSNALRTASLPQSSISVRAEGVIASEFGRTQFTRVTVSPVIRGADLLRRDEYEKTAVAARDSCLVGRSIRGNVAYVVGDVVLLRSTE